MSHLLKSIIKEVKSIKNIVDIPETKKKRNILNQQIIEIQNEINNQQIILNQQQLLNDTSNNLKIISSLNMINNNIHIESLLIQFNDLIVVTQTKLNNNLSTLKELELKVQDINKQLDKMRS